MLFCVVFLLLLLPLMLFCLWFIPECCRVVLGIVAVVFLALSSNYLQLKIDCWSVLCQLNCWSAFVEKENERKQKKGENNWLLTRWHCTRSLTCCSAVAFLLCRCRWWWRWWWCFCQSQSAQFGAFFISLHSSIQIEEKKERKRAESTATAKSFIPFRAHQAYENLSAMLSLIFILFDVIFTHQAHNTGWLNVCACVRASYLLRVYIIL